MSVRYKGSSIRLIYFEIQYTKVNLKTNQAIKNEN